MSEWISVEDRMPGYGVGVLITDGGVITSAQRYLNDDGSWCFVGHGFDGFAWNFDFDDSDVTHWMPLPLPPK